MSTNKKIVETNPQDVYIKDTKVSVKTVMEYEETGPPPTNHPPVVDAGLDQTVKPKSTVILDGSKSYDPDNDAITFQWSQTFGTQVQLTNANQSKASFVAPDISSPPPPTGETKLEPATITASSEDVGKEGRLVNDENFETRWSADGDGEWLEFTFDKPYNITKVKLTGYHLDKSYYFEIAGKRFENPANRTANTLQEYDLTDLNITDSSIRLVGHGNSGSTYNSYREIHFYTGSGGPPPTGSPVAVIKPDVLEGTEGSTITVNGTSSQNASRYSWSVVGDLAINGAVDQATAQLKIIGPTDSTVTLTVTNSAGRTNSTSKTVKVVTTPPPPNGGEIDSMGIKWIEGKGKQSMIKQTRDTADDDRWSGNVTGLANFVEATFIGKSIGISSDGHFAMKLFGGNHSGSGASSQRWYDMGLRANGDVQTQWEGPHPSNHDVSLPAAKQFIKNIGKGLEGNWIGLKWIVNKVKPGGSPADGGVRVRMWVDKDPIGTDGKPRNNWELCFDFIDGVDIQVINPQSYKAPDEQDCEVRRSNTENHEVYGGGLHVRALGTGTLSKTETRKAATDTLSFELKVTDSKGLSNTDTVNVTVSADDVPPPTGCPAGQCKDPITNQCRPIGVNETVDANGFCKANPPPPPTGKVIIAHVGDTHGEKEPLQEIITKVKPNFLIHSGDITDTESDDDNYIQYTKDLGLTYGKDFANSQGNHESPEEGGEGAQGDMESAFPVLKQTKWMQTYQIGNVFIIIGNTQISGYSQPDNEHMRFIEQSLAKAKQLRDSGQIDWVFYCQHKPYYTMKARHDSEYNFRYNVHPMFDLFGLDVSLHGHNHDMQRSKPIMFGGIANAPPIVNSRMIGDAHDLSQIPHGHLNCINGSSTKNTSFSGEQDTWTVYANANANAYSVYTIEGKKLTGQYIEIGTGKILHEFKATKA